MKCRGMKMGSETYVGFVALELSREAVLVVLSDVHPRGILMLHFVLDVQRYECSENTEMSCHPTFRCWLEEIYVQDTTN